MKIKLQRNEDEYGNVEWSEGGNVEVEIPDAIVADWRETTARLAQLEAYFEEHAKPQIDAEYQRSHEQWRREYPEDARREDMVRKVYSRALIKSFEQSFLPTLYKDKP